MAYDEQVFITMKFFSAPWKEEKEKTTHSLEESIFTKCV